MTTAALFVAGSRLWWLVGVAALLAAYVVMQSRRRRYAVRFTNLALLSSVAPRRPGWRRHLPAAALLLGLIALVTALARPARIQRVAKEKATIIMAVDVSLSMAATDVVPSRLDAAKVAAASFVDQVPAGINLGLVAFSESTQVLAPPTEDHASVKAAVGQLALGPGTAIGDAIFTSLATIGAQADKAAGGRPPPARIVLMSDGKTTVGRTNQSAADAAAAAGVPVTTIAFGTDSGMLTYRGQTVAVPVDKEPLRQIAQTTHGAFFEATTAEALKSVYSGLGSAIGSVTRRQELTTWFLGLGLALVVAAAIGSLAWSSRLP